MSKLVQAFLTGAFFTFFIDFFLFLGIKINYIDLYEIDLYYNVLFADNQNIFIYLFFTLLFGYIITYLEHVKIGLIVIGGMFVLTLSTLVPTIGHEVGSHMLQTKNVKFHDSKYVYKGDIYYDGRKQVTFYDYDLQKILTLNKKDLK
ncbi:MAG: hypothetical protein Q9M32_01405 [Sulfurimonas sp.]|nr:hypothetical protein [Sulfurimonas sp.]